MFEKATRLKLRFDSSKGPLAAEDLWDLPLAQDPRRANLDDIAISLHRQLKNGEDVSFVDKEKKSDAIVQLKFDIVKHVIEVRLAERDLAATAKGNAEQKQKILGIIAEKEGESLKGKSLDELKAMVAGLK